MEEHREDVALALVEKGANLNLENKVSIFEVDDFKFSFFKHIHLSEFCLSSWRQALTTEYVFIPSVVGH